MHYILCKDQSWIKALKQEISENLSHDFTVAEGFPLIKLSQVADLQNTFLAFSTTALINAIELAEESIGKQAAKITELIIEKLGSEIKINCHVFSLTNKYGILETGRAEILKDKLIGNLKKSKIFCRRTDFERSLPFVQVLVLADRSIALSILDSSEMQDYHSLVSPYVGGFNNVEDDKKAPSRAYRKIVEAQELMGISISPQEVLVDLGASPGGWSYIARKQGAKVIALDRSPLRVDLMDGPMVDCIQGDAFKYKVQQKIDWAVSDIISTPERVMELLDYWVLNNNCQHFIFTIKFQGDENYNILSQFKELAGKSNFKIILKRLNANKNEATIMGTQNI